MFKNLLVQKLFPKARNFQRSSSFQHAWLQIKAINNFHLIDKTWFQFCFPINIKIMIIIYPYILFGFHVYIYKICKRHIFGYVNGIIKHLTDHCQTRHKFIYYYYMMLLFFTQLIQNINNLICLHVYLMFIVEINGFIMYHLGKLGGNCCYY